MKKIFVLLILITSSLLGACVSPPAPEPSASFEPLATAAQTALIPAQTVSQSKVLARYAGYLEYYDNTAADSQNIKQTVENREKVLITVFQDCASVCIISSGSYSHIATASLLIEENQLTLTIAEDFYAGLETIIIRPATGEESGYWGDFTGITTRRDPRSVYILRLISLGEPDQPTQSESAYNIGWQPDYADVTDDIAGVFCLTPAKQGALENDYYAAFSYPDDGFEAAVHFRGVLYPPEHGSIHIGMPMTAFGLSGADTRIWDSFLAPNSNSELVDVSFKHKDYYSDTALPKLIAALGKETDSAWLIADSKLLFAYKGIISGNFEGGNQDAVVEYINKSFGKEPPVAKKDFEPVSISPEEWVRQLRECKDKYEIFHLYKRNGIYLGYEPEGVGVNDKPAYFGSRQSGEGEVEDCALAGRDGIFIFRKDADGWKLTDYLDYSAYYSGMDLDRILLSNGDETESALLYFGYQVGNGTGYFQDVAYWYDLDTRQFVLSNFGSGYHEYPATDSYLGDAIDFSYKVSPSRKQLILTFKYTADYYHWINDDDVETGIMLEASRDVVFNWADKRFAPEKNSPFGSLWNWHYPFELSVGETLELSYGDITRNFKAELLLASRSKHKVTREWAKGMLR